MLARFKPKRKNARFFETDRGRTARRGTKRDRARVTLCDDLGPGEVEGLDRGQATAGDFADERGGIVIDGQIVIGKDDGPACDVIARGQGDGR